MLTWYFTYPQDSAKKASPLIEHPREGFDDEDRQTESPATKSKKSPFSTVNEDPLPTPEKKKQKAKKDSSKTEIPKEKKEKEKAEVIRLKKDEKEVKKKEEERSKEREDKRAEEQELRQKQEEELARQRAEELQRSRRQAEEQEREQARMDSVMKARAEVKVDKVNTLQPKPRNYVNQDGVFLILLLIATLFGWINVFHRKRFIQVLNSAFVARYINQLIREENALLQRVFVMVSVTFILILSVFAYQAMNYFGWNIPELDRLAIFMICVLGVSIIYFSKLLFLNLVGFLFKAEKVVKEYFYNLLLINNLTGILMIPLVLCIAYLPSLDKKYLVFSGLAVYLSSIMYRLFRGMMIGWNTGSYSVFHIFMYLCTLEILPLIVMIKILMSIF